MTLDRTAHLEFNFADDLVRFSENTALVTEQGQVISYVELSELIEQFSNQIEQILPSFSLKRLLFIHCQSGLHSLIAYLYCLSYRHCALLIHADISEQCLSELYQAYSPNIIVRDSPDYVVNKGFDIKVLSTQTLELHQDLAVLLSTSGSTGSPKQVRLSYQNIHTNAHQIAEYLALQSSERAIISLPIHYSYGLSVVNSHLAVGASLVLNSHSIVTKDFWRLFKQFEVTSFSGVPYHYEMLKKLRFERMELPSLKYMTQAGGRLSSVLIKEFATLLKKRGKKFFVMYGQTEATARMAFLSPDDLQCTHNLDSTNKMSSTNNLEGTNKLESIGQAIPGGVFSIISDSGEVILGEGCVGELVYKGGNVMMGYANSIKELKHPAEVDALYTGDLAYKDEHGFFYIVGRKNRIAKLFGTRIDLEDLDKRMAALGLNTVTVQLDKSSEQKIYVCLERHKSSKASSKVIEQLKTFLVETLNFKQSSFDIINLDSFPRTHNGKIAFSEIKKQLTETLREKHGNE